MMYRVQSCARRPSRPAHGRILQLVLAATVATTALPAQASAQVDPRAIQAAVRSTGARDLDMRSFYSARAHRPLWIRGDTIGPEADMLLDLIASAELDGLDPEDYRPRALASAIRKARDGSPKALARAEAMLSSTFAAYVRDVRRPRPVGMIYVDRELEPTIPSARAVLNAAAAAPSLATHLENVGWMHPLYGQLRRAIERGGATSARDEQLLRLNLERARALPADRRERYVLVDAAAARLWMYEDGRPIDSMRVVVGKPSEPTPMMAGLIRFTTVNPYWNIPPDLVRNKVAPAVLSQGVKYLRSKRYEILSDWTDKARVVKPEAVDWKAVASGQRQLRVRQLPGPGNAMGKMKFMFPNSMGIYLHDTPEKDLLREDDRLFSSGCVRVEDAPRLARWLYGKPLSTKTKADQEVDLDYPVPVYITYLTAAPEGQRIAYRRDVYNRDRAQLAGLFGGTAGGR